MMGACSRAQRRQKVYLSSVDMSRGHSGDNEQVISISGATEEEEKSAWNTGRDKSTCHCSQKKVKEKKNKKFLLITDRGLKRS